MRYAFGRVLMRAARKSRTVSKARVGIALDVPPLTSFGVVRCAGAVRFESTETTPSRFLSLVDDEEAEDGEGGDEDEEYEEDSEGQDGDVDADPFPDINEGGVEENDEVDELIMELFLENPIRWTPDVLSRKFHLSKPRVEAIIWLKRMEAELTPEEFRAKVQEAKEKATKEMEEQAKQLADAEARGNEMEVARLKKRARQEEEATQPDYELNPHEEAMLRESDEETFRNPEFFFLNDEFEGYPPLVRRMGRHGYTDQLYPEEAIELQRLASNNKIELQKSFANPNYSKNKAKCCLAIKEIATKKKHLLVRDESHTLRLATEKEVLARTWVRRSAYFRGLDKELA